MAVTITAAQLAIAIRAAASEDAIPDAVTTVIGFLLPAASAVVLDYAPHAPDAVHNAAAIRLSGWLYDAEPSDPRVGSALRVSGAQALLSHFREHRAGAVGPAAVAPPAPVPAGDIPTPPADGHFILISDDGALAWLEFPAPS